MSSNRPAFIGAILTLGIVAAVSTFGSRTTGAADPGAMDAMSIDMDITGNSATSLGPWDECVIASPGDTVTVDVTAANIPATNPMIAFTFRMNFVPGVVTVASYDPNFQLVSAPGSSLFDISDSVPDSDGAWNAAAIDVSDSTFVPAESGSGVLARTILNIDAAASSGVYPLSLDQTVHIDTQNEPRLANAVNNAFIAINATCENLPTPSPTPVPTPTPATPAATPPPTPATPAATPPPTPGPTPGPTPPPISVPCEPGGPSLTMALGIDHDLGTADINLGPAYAAPGGQVLVCLVLTAHDPVGAYTVDVYHDPSVVGVLGCGSISGGLCNSVAIDRTRFVGASTSGFVGSLALGSVAFTGVGPPGQCTDLTLQVLTFADPTGSDMTPPAISNGQVCISEGPVPTPTAAVTPTPGPVPTPTSIATPTPGPVTPAPSAVPGGPPPFDPGGVICFEDLESASECDGDSSPGAASDIRTKICVGWNDDCTARDFIVNDSNFGRLVSFTPPEWYLPRGDTIPIGAIAGRLQSEVSLGLLNNPCNTRVQVAFSLLNGSINTADAISPRPDGQTDVMQPLAMDANGNGVPDGADRYPDFLHDFFGGTAPRERLFGITHIMGGWVAVNLLFFEPGSTLHIGGTTITFNPALGYPAVFLLQDPTAQAAPSAISDFCAPQLAHFIVLGSTLDNPCTPASVPGANCPVTGDFPPEISSSSGEPYPSFPCDPRSRFDDDGDGKINDGCPQYGQTAESGAQCDNDISDDPEDSHVNDGCPAFGDVSEGARIPGDCTAADEGGCTYRSNPASTGTETFTTMALSQRDADGDGIENNLDVCVAMPNPEWNPRAMDPINDSDFDGLPNVCDPQPNQSAPGSPLGCRSGYTGADEDQDCFSNRADNCPTDTQLLHPGLPPDNFPQTNTNPPLAPDQDADGIGDVCDPDPLAPNGQYVGYCMKFGVNVGGPAGPVTAVRDPQLAPDCAAQAPLPSPVPAPSPTPTPTAGPPIEIDLSIHETGGVIPREGLARVHGIIECGRPALVELEVEVVQRAGRAFIVGVAETAVWCDGQVEWSVDAAGNGRFVGGWVNVSVHAEAQAGMSYGADDESARVRLAGQRPHLGGRNSGR